MRAMQRVATAIEWYTRTRGYPPTLREISEAAGYHSTGSVYVVLRRMRDRGLLTWRVGSSRTYRLTDEGRALVEEGVE